MSDAPVQPAPFNLIEARLNRGLSQRELAAAVGVSTETVRRLEEGKTAFPRNAKKVADFFEVLVTDVMPVGNGAAK